MWAPVLQPDKACLDRDTCSVVASVNAELAKPGVKRGGNQRTGSDTHEGHEGHEEREGREGQGAVIHPMSATQAYTSPGR